MKAVDLKLVQFIENDFIFRYCVITIHITLTYFSPKYVKI